MQCWYSGLFHTNTWMYKTREKEAMEIKSADKQKAAINGREYI